MSKSVIITGASAGIGKALAYEFAARGYNLGLTARRHSLLETIQADLQKLYSGQSIQVCIETLDVMDQDAVFSVIPKLDQDLGGVGIVIANAGIALRRPVGSHEFEKDHHTIATNLLGAMATIESAVRIFKERGEGGQIVGISSVAGFRGLPRYAAYSASKAALSNYLDAIYHELRPFNIRITNINPGFIDTDINDRSKNEWYVSSVEYGAVLMVDIIEHRWKSAVVPWMPWWFIGTLLRLVPGWLFGRLLKG